VHYRLVYVATGRCEAIRLARRKPEKWTIEKDQLCLFLSETEDGCYEVAGNGERIEMTHVGLGGSLDGILRPASRN
jgi:hypothetical protein